MPKLPVLKPRDVVALLRTFGFQCVRQRGSHMQFRHSDGRCTTVPDHALSLLRQIAKDIGMAPEDFVRSVIAPRFALFESALILYGRDNENYEFQTNKMEHRRIGPMESGTVYSCWHS